MKKFEPEFARNYIALNKSGLGISEDTSLLILAREYGVEQEWQSLLSDKEKTTAFRRDGRTSLDLLADLCTPKKELMLYTGSPQVYEFDDQHLLVDGLSSVDAEGRVVGSYPRLLVMRDLFRDNNGHPLSLTPFQAIGYAETKGYFLPPANLSFALLVALFQHQEKDFAKAVLRQYQENIHAQNTVVNYGRQKIINFPREGDFPANASPSMLNAARTRTELPFQKSMGRSFWKKNLESMTLGDGLNHPLVSAFVKQFTGLADPSFLMELGRYFQKPVNIWFPSDINNVNGTHAAWFGCNSYSLNLSGDISLGSGSAARGVRVI